MPTPRVRQDHAHVESPPVRVLNAACPRCNGPVYYSRNPRLWLYCVTCPVRLAPTAKGGKGVGRG